MAHEVESMMYVGKTPWHGLGKAIPEGKVLNIDEAIYAAGLNWEVGLKHIYAEVSSDSKVGLLDYYATYRTTDNALLGVVGSHYKPLQNRDVFKWFQPFLDAQQAVLETAGSLKGGKKAWVLAKIRDSQNAVKGDDEIINYVLLSNSHDGSQAVRVGFTPVRVVCNNTLCMAHQSKASKLLRVRHTRHLLYNLDNIREIMNLANREFAATVEQYKRLINKSINSADLEKYVRKVFSLKKNQGKKLIPQVVWLFENGRGSREAGSTYWGAYNAVNGYLNYFKGTNQDTRLDTLWFGQSERLNKRALTIALKMAA